MFMLQVDINKVVKLKHSHGASAFSLRVFNLLRLVGCCVVVRESLSSSSSFLCAVLSGCTYVCVCVYMSVGWLECSLPCRLPPVKTHSASPHHIHPISVSS